MMTQSTSLLQFPCDFSLKVMGKNNEIFEKTVYKTVIAHIPHLSHDALENRPSKNNNYLSITVRFEAKSKEQLDNLYKALTANEQIMMAL